MFEWVKLFIVDGHQVLFYLEPDGDDHILHQCTSADDIFADVALRFGNDTKDNSRKAFDMITEETARNLLKMRRELLGEMSKPEADDDGDEE